MRRHAWGFRADHETAAVKAGVINISAAIAAAFIACCVLCCAGRIPAGETDACITPKDAPPDRGWIDGNTYQLTCCGFSSKEEGPMEKRKEQARKGALAACQWRIMNVFTEEYDKKYKELYSHYMSIDTTGIPAWRKELLRIIKSGTVVYEKCVDAGACSMTYRVSKNGLRRWVDDLPNVLEKF